MAFDVTLHGDVCQASYILIEGVVVFGICVINSCLSADIS